MAGSDARTTDLPGEDPDAVVVRRIRGGETHLFELPMRRHNQRVFRAARAIVSDGEAEDVMQDAYVRAFTALDRPGSLTADQYLAILAFDLKANGIDLPAPLTMEKARTLTIPR